MPEGPITKMGEFVTRESATPPEHQGKTAEEELRVRWLRQAAIPAGTGVTLREF